MEIKYFFLGQNSLRTKFSIFPQSFTSTRTTYDSFNLIFSEQVNAISAQEQPEETLVRTSLGEFIHVSGGAYRTEANHSLLKPSCHI